VGSSQVLKTDVRVIAATNVDLTQKIKAGKFREDLYYRLNTVPIKVPSLKERKEDIPMLFRKFCIDFAEKYRSLTVRLDEQATMLLTNYSWPGNIRELKNVAEQVSVLSEDKMMSAEDLVSIVPSIMVRNLPSFQLDDEKSSGKNGYYERELLYKLLFEMKKDMNDLKTLIFELIQSNNLDISNVNSLRTLQLADFESNNTESDLSILQNVGNSIKPNLNVEISHKDQNIDSTAAYLLNSKKDNQFNNAEVVDENMSLEDMEKEMINRALKKHSSKRKEAADDLGISERTLYRKIKQYDIAL
jgi:DNA-binding NtrC family response regulator